LNGAFKIMRQLNSLYIDDHPDLCISISYALEERYSITQVLDESEAERFMRQEHFDLLLIDYWFGHNTKTGVQLIEQYRNQYPHIPSVLITAYATYELEAECEAKSIPLICKPIKKTIPHLIKTYLDCFRKNPNWLQAYDELKKQVNPVSEPKPWCPHDEPALYEQIYLDHKDIALHWATDKTKNREEAEHIVQDSFLSLWTNPNLIFSAYKEFKNYIWKTLVSRWIDWVKTKRKKHHVDEDIEMIQDESKSIFESLELKEMEETFWKAVGDLSETEQLVFKMHYIERKTLQEIADKINKSLQATQKILQRARNKIKKLVHF